MTNTTKFNETLNTLRNFLPLAEWQTVKETSTGGEGPLIKNLLTELEARILAIPKPYEQDGKGDKAVAYLHYFSGGSDWYILERDLELNEQVQCFGWAILNGDRQNAELGYISIAELVANGVECDLHWTPTTLGEVQANHK